ncbi:MAG: hypothetical protein C0471_17580 [Erythrobacter sp.]|nr:hypothetical protein [Erythrobacter sp.]
MLSPSKFIAKYAKPFISPISKRPYDAGIYVMSENLTAVPVYSVWQYYLFDQNNVFLNRGKGPIDFRTAMVADGQSVIWRLVNVAAGPIPLSPRLENAFAEQAK